MSDCMVFFHAAVTVLQQIDTGCSRKYRNRNCKRNCGRMAPMQQEVYNLAAVTVSAVAITVGEMRPQNRTIAVMRYSYHIATIEEFLPHDYGKVRPHGCRKAYGRTLREVLLKWGGI